jgi:hypothetical protein
MSGAVVIATGWTGWTAHGLEFESRYGQDFSPLHVVQTGSGAHLASYPMNTGTGALSPGLKRSKREADHSSPISAGMKIMWINTSIPIYVFTAYCLIS